MTEIVWSLLLIQNFTNELSDSFCRCIITTSIIQQQKAKPISELREKLKGGVIAKDEAIHAETTNFQNRYQTQIKSDPEFFVSLTEEEKIEYYLDTEKRIAYISTAPINRCPSCMTALANEDLDGNNCERCGSVIERKKMRQWMIRITDYAQRLLDGLDLLPDRQDNIKAMQRHWIGKSEGTIVEFETVQNHTKIPVYTTRIDTIF
jgi:leucyl-tRNA synthetase